MEEWLGAHGRSSLDPRVLAREWPDVKAEQLASAIQSLVKAGVLEQVFRVLTPNGVLADGEFPDPSEIPEKLPDRSNNYFETAEADIIPVFKRHVA
ncbi:MAG: hypothetical protein ABSG41_26790 [Bryobacteraceae bacterium]